MDSGTVAIKKNMGKIDNIIYDDGIIYCHSSDETYRIKVLADDINGLDNLFDECKDKILVKITYENNTYDDDLRPFESVVTYCGGVFEWFAYRSYTFHFDDETCSTIELRYSSPDVIYPELTFMEEQ